MLRFRPRWTPLFLCLTLFAALGAAAQDERIPLDDPEFEKKVRAAFEKYVDDPKNKEAIKPATDVAKLKEVIIKYDPKAPSMTWTFPARKSPPGDISPVRKVVVSDFLGQKVLEEGDYEKLIPQLVVAFTDESADLKKQVAALAAQVEKLAAQIGDAALREAVEARTKALTDQLTKVEATANAAAKAAAGLEKLAAQVRDAASRAEVEARTQALAGQLAKVEAASRAAANVAATLEKRVKEAEGTVHMAKELAERLGTMASRLDVLEKEAARGRSAAPARITVLLPEDAKLYVDEVFCPLTSGVRTFFTNTLDGTTRYQYTLRLEILREGRLHTASRRIYLEAGKETIADLRNLIYDEYGVR